MGFAEVEAKPALRAVAFGRESSETILFARVRAEAALGALPVACAAGAFAARLWIEHAPRAIATDLAQPLPVVTAWGNYGAVGFAILAIALAAATLALVVAARAARAAGAARADTTVVVAIAALALAANLAWPATFSSDVYAYAAYGDLALQGLNPYFVVPAHAHDAFLDAARVQWSGPFPVCVYGPLFVAFARTVVLLGSPFGVAATLWTFRASACAAFLGSIALLGLALRNETRERRSLALYAYGLNPVALWSVAEGHNDALLLFAATAAFALARRGNNAVGTFALALGPLIKAPGAALAFVYALRATWLGREPASRTWAAVAAGTVVAVSLAVPPLLPALASVGAHGVYAPTISVQGLIGPVWAGLFAAGLLANAARLFVRRDASGFAWAGLALVAALPNTYPWYGLWLLPWVLAAGPGAASVALWAATIFAVVRYLPDATGNMTAQAAQIAAAIAALPFALALTALRPSAFRRKTTTPP